MRRLLHCWNEFLAFGASGRDGYTNAQNVTLLTGKRCDIFTYDGSGFSEFVQDGCDGKADISCYGLSIYTGFIDSAIRLRKELFLLTQNTPASFCSGRSVSLSESWMMLVVIIPPG